MERGSFPLFFFFRDEIVEQVKGTPELQERIISSYQEARSDPDLAEQLLMAAIGGGSSVSGVGSGGIGGTTSTSTIYENYLDGLHCGDGTQPPSPPPEDWHLASSPPSPPRCVELRLTIEKGVPCVYNKIGMSVASLGSLGPLSRTHSLDI